MNTGRNLETPPAGFTPADLYFVVFRHKWIILVLTVLGVAAASAFYLTRQPVFQSDAVLFIRYVTDNRPLNPSENNSRMTSLIDNQNSLNVLNLEMQIMCSLDLAMQVATNFGAEKLLAKSGGGNDLNAAAGMIRGGLKLDPIKDSADILVTFHHPDIDLVRPVLAELIKDYQEKHVLVHRPISVTDDTLADQIFQLRTQIEHTEDELRMAKTNAGIISVTDAEKSYEEELARIRRELLQAKASLAEHQTSLRELASAPEPKNPVTNALSRVPTDDLARYKSVCGQLNYLERRQNEYLQQGYTDENKLVKENRQRAVEMANAKIELEKKFPALIDLDTSAAPGTDSLTALPPASVDSIQVAALPLRIKELQAQFDEIQLESARLNEAEMKISELERKKSQLEDNFKFYQSMQIQAQIDEALGPGRGNNIQVIQQPSPPYKYSGKLYKTTAMMAISGLIAGMLWAFLMEFYLDRSVKRPEDVRIKLRMPFFLSIPDLNHQPRRRVAASERRRLAFNGSGNGNVNGNGGGNGAASPAAIGVLEVASPEINHALRSHCDALRDRLVNYFESINLTRKPKLVTITSAGKGAGVSTISAGLAASLSETGDGRVLLVDMNLEDGAAQQFVHGKMDCRLDDALTSEKRDHARVQENLYVVSEGSNVDKLPRILPKRFAALMPKLKASDYDYIIFDMPPVSQTSVTTRLAGFMDTVMLVIESEKTDCEVVQQANQLLLQSKAQAAVVLNKTRKYVPAQLQHELHSDT